MEKIILIFFKVFGPISLIASLLILVIPIIKKKTIKKDNNNTKVLNADTIIYETDIITGLTSFVFMFLFIIVGIIVIYLGIAFNNVLVSLTFGGLCIGIPLVILMKVVIRYNNVSKGKYVIVEDVLKDKEMIFNHYNQDDVDHRDYFYYFYFKDYFSKYNERISVSSKKFYNSKEGEPFYLVFCNKEVYVFNKKEYNLEDNSKVVDINELYRYTNVKKYTDKINTDVIMISKNRIKNDFYNKQEKKSVVFSIVVTLILLTFCICFYNSFLKFNIIALIIVLIMFIFFLIMTVCKIKYLYTIIKNIKHNNFKIKIDTVTSLNNRVDFKDSNGVISFKFKNYKKIVYADKEDYNIIDIGDEFYLVFVKGEKEPVKVYRLKDSILDGDVREQITQ